MEKLILKSISTLFTICFFISSFAYNNRILLPIPYVDIQKEAQIAKAQFELVLQKTTLSVNQHFAQPILGIAPLGGSKVTAFKELDLDGLVIIDWDRPGTPSSIYKTFTDTKLHRILGDNLYEALNFGAMNTSTVMQTAVSAQILARLWYELGVSTVRIHYYLPKNITSPLPANPIQLWDGNHLRDDDIPLITRFLFNYKGRPKELVFISAKITADEINSRTSLPVNILKNLAPGKFHWGYLSADGLIFFSKKKDNGLRKGNQEFLDLLTSNAGVILDYPENPNYNTCRGPYDGILAMCGRGDLADWKLQNIQKIPVNRQVFGYSGLFPGDEVRIYLKTNEISEFVNATDIFSFADLIQIDDEYQYDLIGLPSSLNMINW